MCWIRKTFAVIVSTMALASPALAQVVVKQGNVSLPQTYGFDLDAGAYRPPGDHAADMFFSAVKATPDGWFLQPVNGSKFSSISFTPHGYHGCVNSTYSAQEIPVPNIWFNSHICYITSNKNIGEMILNPGMYAPPNPFVFQVSYTTWCGGPPLSCLLLKRRLRHR